MATTTATTSWLWTILLILVAAAALQATPAPPLNPETHTTPMTPTPPPPHQPPPPRRAEVVVIDVTKNTSSVVSISLDVNATAPDARQLKESASLRCITELKANVFLLVHLNRNWRQKLDLVRRLVAYTYEKSSTNVVIVLFNAFTDILATFGANPLTSLPDLLAALGRVQAAMERDEAAAVSEHWNYFQLDDALKACFRYAKLFLHPFSLDARPSLLFSYFDDSAVITDATIEDAERVLRQFGPESPFRANVSILQWPSSLPVPPQWARVSELLSSSPSFQVTGSTEDNLFGLVADLAGDFCNKTRTRAP